MRPAFRILTVSVLSIPLLYLGFWPVPVTPEAWEAPIPVPRAPTGDLADAVRVEILDGEAPEDVEVDPEGRVYGGLADGRIVRFTEGRAEPFADTGGRPLGLHWDAAGNLLVADAHRGLLSITPEGEVTSLTTHCGGLPLGFTDDLETDASGVIWFSDASTKFSQPSWKLDILENQPNGRLCAYDPSSKETRLVIDDLYFANGVAVDPDQRFVLVNETSRYRVRRLWLTGSNAGKHEILIDNLPGFPDGISSGTNGLFWIAIASPRNSLVDGAADKPWLRKMMVRLPRVLQPAPVRSARVLGIDKDGHVLHDLHDSGGSTIAVSTSVQERAGWLFIGSLTDHAYARVQVPRRGQR